MVFLDNLENGGVYDVGEYESVRKAREAGLAVETIDLKSGKASREILIPMGEYFGSGNHKFNVKRMIQLGQNVVGIEVHDSMGQDLWLQVKLD